MEPYYIIKEEESMKTGKRMLCFLLAVVMSCGMGLTGNSMKAEAAAKVEVTKYIRCGVGECRGRQIKVYMPGKEDDIKNIKVYAGKKTTKNLVVKQTARVKSSNKKAAYEAELTIYAKKKGTYKIKFDVYKSKNSKRSSHTITVRARGEGIDVLDKVTINGKKVYDMDTMGMYRISGRYYTTAKSGKVKFKLDEGCKIDSITMYTYTENDNRESRPFKNGSKVTFGKYGIHNRSSSDGWRRPLWGITQFVINYTDKNTGTQGATEFYIYKR